MRLQKIENGTRLTVYHDSRRQEAIVDGDPYVMGIAGHGEYPQLVVRIPCHLPESNENVDVAGGNVIAISEDIPL